VGGQVSPRQQYIAWVEDQVEDFKAAVSREDLMSIAEEAVDELFDHRDGQYPLTEILLRDAVDALIIQRLGLPTYRQWLRTCPSDTPPCPEDGTPREGGDESQTA
jgi:hypothetical protein